MATRAQLEAYARNPNARKFLDFISKAEGTTQHGYNTNFGGSRLNDLSKHPNVKRPFTDLNGKKDYSTASGRYQFLKSSWDGQAKKYGLTDFSPLSQDIGALGLILDSKALNDVLSGNFNAAIKKLGNIWASFPTSTHPQNKRSWATANKWLGSTQPPSSIQESLNYMPMSVGQAIGDVSRGTPDDVYADFTQVENVPRGTTDDVYTDITQVENVPRGTLEDMVSIENVYSPPQMNVPRETTGLGGILANPYTSQQTYENPYRESLVETLQEPRARGFGVFVEG